MITNIIFTKDRPLQLHGYLKSLFFHFPHETVQPVLLYKPHLFEAEYRQVFDEFPTCRVIRETDFFWDTWNAVHQVDTPYLLFGIDDVVFFESVDLDRIIGSFRNHPNEIFGFSLRLRPPSRLPGGPYKRHSIDGSEVYSVSWPDGDTSSTRYPFELCATIYTAPLVRYLFSEAVSRRVWARKFFCPNSPFVRTYGRLASPRSLLKKFGFYYNPNTLESWVCRWCRNHSHRLPRRLFFEKACAAALQVNLVNTATPNTIPEHELLDVHELTRCFREGYRLDIDGIRRSPPDATHVGREYFRLKSPP